MVKDNWMCPLTTKLYYFCFSANLKKDFLNKFYILVKLFVYYECKDRYVIKLDKTIQRNRFVWDCVFTRDLQKIKFVSLPSTLFFIVRHVPFKSIVCEHSSYSHKPWLPKLLNPDQYQARPKLALWRRFQFLVFDLCPCHQLANFFRLNRLCRLKTNAHVRSLFYAVVCIILNVSVGVFPIFELN